MAWPGSVRAGHFPRHAERADYDLLSVPLADALRRPTHPEGPAPETRNRAFHRMLVNGIAVEYPTGAGVIRDAPAPVIDFDNPATNDWFINSLPRGASN